MNVQLKDITVTARDGRVSHLDQVYIRGSHVRFFIVPDMLRYVLIHRHKLERYTHTFHGLLSCMMYNRKTTADPLPSLVTLPCSVHEASAGAVSVWRVVRLLCSVRVANAAAVKCGGVTVSRPRGLRVVGVFLLCFLWLGESIQTWFC